MGITVSYPDHLVGVYLNEVVNQIPGGVSYPDHLVGVYLEKQTEHVGF